MTNKFFPVEYLLMSNGEEKFGISIEPSEEVRADVREGIRLLHVEDDTTYHRAFAGNLEMRIQPKPNIKRVYTLKAFREVLRQQTFDAIILDYDLTNFTAEDVLPILEEEGKSDIPCILLTGKLTSPDTEEIIDRLKEGGVRRVFLKGRLKEEGWNEFISALKEVIEFAEVSKELEKQRVEADRLRGVLEMAGAVGHEFNQPLQVIGGVIELLFMDPVELQQIPKAVQQKLKTIQDQINKLAKLSRQVGNIRRRVTQPYTKEIGDIIDIKASSESDKAVIFNSDPASWKELVKKLNPPEPTKEDS